MTQNMAWRAQESARIEQLHTNAAGHLPSPGCPLICTLDDGSEVAAIRPSYIADRSANPGYATPAGAPIDNVVRWRYA